MKTIWEELESLNVLPAIGEVNAEVAAFLKALGKQNEEHKLFQFLNGLDDAYGPQRSQILMMRTLHLLKQHKDRGKSGNASSKWNKSKKGGSKSAAIVQSSNQSDSGFSSTSSGNQFTMQQIKAMLRMMPTASRQAAPNNDDELEISYAGMVSCYFAESITNGWIIDSGASDHMTGNLDNMLNVVKSINEPKINMPTGHTASISHIGNVRLENGLSLKNVLYVPSFKHNLLSVKKLLQDSKCRVQFYAEYCIIEELQSSVVKGIGVIKNGLYYLKSEQIESVIQEMKKEIMSKNGIKNGEKSAMTTNTYSNVPSMVKNAPVLSSRTLWHHRLGHAPFTRIEKIHNLKGVKSSSSDVCLTCPLAKFTKLPYNLSVSREKEPFELVHLDTWGPYRVPTKGKYKYFLTLVDD
uniref:GAG-pre-integrase domain-containing protein n=1 Tax=Chenopodium quinoa TaxID=63459 RepID=A0A803KUW9_CHEQI